MSLFSALGTSVSGLTAQSAAFSNISDNVANSQTVGYKAVNTSFIDYLTTSNAEHNDSGSVTTRPDYTNSVQGALSQSSDPLALAIAGNGFFVVSKSSGAANGTNAPTFSAQTYYTRAGDFQLDTNGYIVNSAGEYLQGWPIDATTGVANQSSLAPIQVPQARFNPVATSTLNLSANLPSSGTSAPASSQVSIYDSLGNQHQVTLTWTKSAAAGAWSLALSSPDVSGGTIGSTTVQFGTNGVPAGTIGSFSGSTGLTASSFAANDLASLTFTADFGAGPQTVHLDLGHFGQGDGVTQFAGNSYTLSKLSQDGIPPGNFTNITFTSTGDVVANFDNGQTRTIAQVPIATFADPDALQRQNGQAFTVTSLSGSPAVQSQGSNGAGSLVTGSVESSNVDIATEFSKLIVAQEAYGANAKVVTSADSLLQVTINMKT